MSKIKGLMKDTAIYGMSSIVGRFLNWCLVPLYTYRLANVEDYGVINNLYGWTAFALVILTYGMETGFLRFANKEGNDPQRVYSTSLLSVGASTLLFLVVSLLFLDPIVRAIRLEDYRLLVANMIIIVSMDAFTSIPFVYLRFKNRPYRFAFLKLLFVGLNIALNLFFLLAAPMLYKAAPEWVDWFYQPGSEVNLIIWANIISTGIVSLALLPEISEARSGFDSKLWKELIRYSLPLLILGIAGIISQTIDKLLYPFLFDNTKEALFQLGIYGANFKIAVVLIMFTQAFRFAYEPFIFAQSKDKNDRRSYAQAMKYFWIISLFLFLTITCSIDLLKYLISPAYYEGLHVVPIIMVAQLLFGVYFNLSLWYKLSDRTSWGAYFSILGCVLTVLINIGFVPHYGYIASAWASVASYGAITLLSFGFGQHFYPIPYDLKSMARYGLFAALLYVTSEAMQTVEPAPLRIGLRTCLPLFFLYDFYRREQLSTMIHTAVARLVGKK